MDAGVLLTAIYGREDDPRQQVREHKELVRTAEQLGFTHMVAGQHFIGTELRFYQPIPYLAAMSQSAPSMRVVTHIMLLSMAHPVTLSEEISTLDAVTDGKAIFGIGLGYTDREFAALGIEPRSKVRRFESNLELIKKLWSGEPVTDSSDRWELVDALPSVIPVQKPRMPIWIGGQSTPAIKRAARSGDAWCAPPFPDHAGLRQLAQIFKEEREAAGLPPATEFPVRRELVIAKTRGQAKAMAEERSAGRYRTYARWGLRGENTPVEEASDEQPINVEDRFLLGDPAEIAEQLLELKHDLGMTNVMVKPHWPGLPHTEAMHQLELFGTEVLPQLRDYPAASRAHQEP
jgi:alkanesulfonate monooxygenase SsuD/methylene tetrahydromethanopterin reductase-like flavin-dependent oxidoreductase (luciferase family)